MLSDLTDPDAVRRAAAEFDELGRDKFLAKYGFGESNRYFASVDGREYDSKALVGVAYGYQFPDRDRLTSANFSGGHDTVGRVLTRLGFQFVDRTPRQVGLSEMLEDVLTELRSRADNPGEFAPRELDDLVQSWLPARLSETVDGYEIVGRTGMGFAADVPWVGLFLQGQANATRGFYLVYLFAKDGSAVFLSLNQGTENVRGGTDVLTKRAIDMRRMVTRPSEMSSPLVETISLGSTNTRPKKYEAGNALAVSYEAGAIPADKALLADLNAFLGMLDELADNGLEWHPEIEPIHLVFKWNADTEPRTIDLHREIADREGSVWWGRFSASPTPSIAATKLDQLQAQLRNGFTTHAYLYRRGSLWRTTVAEIRIDPPPSDDPHFPSYYKREDCNLFVRVTDFIELAPDWLTKNAVLATKPVDDPAKVLAGLSNQSTPMYVFEIGGPSGITSMDTTSNETIVSEVEIDISSVTLADAVNEVTDRLLQAGLSFGDRHKSFVRAALVALITKRFLLLTGLSGSGKTWLGRAFGQWFGADQLRVVPVQPDWTTPESIMGFENVLSEPVEGAHGWTAPEVVEFVLQAASDPDRPYLLVLDEMNLAHVERYFADFLSGMESGEPVIPNLQRVDGRWRQSDPPRIRIPENLFVVGTVNIDETTYMFSPKVLDRANTLEFRVLTSDLNPTSRPPVAVEVGSPAMVRRVLVAATSRDDEDWSARSQLGEWMQELHQLLYTHDREFGHRVYFEALRFGALLSAGGEPDPLCALDLQVLQKVLPRFHGSLRQLSDPLNALGSWCWFGPGGSDGSIDVLAPPAGAAVLPLSFDKIARMTRRLRDNHFVSFAE